MKKLIAMSLLTSVIITIFTMSPVFASTTKTLTTKTPILKTSTPYRDFYIRRTNPCIGIPNCIRIYHDPIEFPQDFPPIDEIGKRLGQLGLLHSSSSGNYILVSDLAKVKSDNVLTPKVIQALINTKQSILYIK